MFYNKILEYKKQNKNYFKNKHIKIKKVNKEEN